MIYVTVITAQPLTLFFYLVEQMLEDCAKSIAASFMKLSTIWVLT